LWISFSHTYCYFRCILITMALFIIYWLFLDSKNVFIKLRINWKNIKIRCWNTIWKSILKFILNSTNFSWILNIQFSISNRAMFANKSWFYISARGFWTKLITYVSGVACALFSILIFCNFPITRYKYTDLNTYLEYIANMSLSWWNKYVIKQCWNASIFLSFDLF
jgi:hypothetical protein